VVEIYHHRAFSKVALDETEIEATLETRGPQHVEELMAALAEKGWSVDRS
jgi:threonine dehydratase